MFHTDEMTVWKAQICAGNDCFDKRQVLTALAYYHKAIEQAQMLMSHWDEPKAGVAALVVSHHNLADLYVREGQICLAECELIKVHENVSTCLHHAEPNSQRATALIWGINQTYVALMAHQKKYPNQTMADLPAIPNLFEKSFKNTLN